MIYEDLEIVVSNIFLARGRNVSEKVVGMWAKEIATRGLHDLAIKEAEKELIEDDETDLTLPKVLAIMYKHNEKYRPKIQRIACEYCNGLNYVYSTLFFEKNGKYVSDNYGLKCFHNTDNNNCAKMVLNPETNNKTETANGYALIFRDIVEREAYLEKVKLNGWCVRFVGKRRFGK